LGIPRSAVEDFAEQRNSTRSNSGPSFALSAKDEVVLILLFLRHFLTDLLLAALFEVSKSTARNTRKRMLEWLYNLLAPRLSFQTSEWRLKGSVTFMTMTFTFAIDGSEQGVTGSTKADIDTKFFSAKKKRHTINILVIIHIRTRKILYVSRSFPGIYNDEYIVKTTLDEWHDKLASTEWGFGDSGFKGLDKLNVRIITPPSRKSPLYKVFSSKRILIEMYLLISRTSRFVNMNIEHLLEMMTSCVNTIWPGLFALCL
jgi:hypothetical protein